VIARWWQRRRDGRALERRAIPDALWHSTLADYPFLASRRSAADVAELRRLTSLFLDRKEFSGAHGFDVTDQIAVAVAAQACLPVLALGLQLYDGFVGIVLHADQVVVAREMTDEHTGVVHGYDDVLSGEAMEGGPVMLSWADVAGGSGGGDSAYNVVIHEFAHVIDMADGTADGIPPLPNAAASVAWQRTLMREFDVFSERAVCGHASVIDPYGAQAPEEFFAVASEAFFVAPAALKEEQPALYRLLASFYRQDPA
jgi:Mlc titration factor MtfA (ptsG expression regulator)